MSATSSLLKASFRVLRERKRLLVFPVLSVGVEAVVIAAFAVPYARALHASSVSGRALNPAWYVAAAAGYLLATAVSTFFNAALFLAVAQTLRGGEPGVRRALATAGRRLPTILAWAVVSCTVGLLVRAIDRKVPIVSAVFGISWSCLSFLALPVLVLENVGVVRGLRSAAEVFRRAWREEVTGTLRLGGLALLLALPACVVMFFGLGSGDGPTMLLALAVCVLWFGLCGLALSALIGVYRVAVYLYATTNTAAPQFAGIELSRAFIPQQ